MSLKLRLIIFCSLIGIVSALITAGIVSTVTSISLDEDTFRQYQDRLTSQRVLTATKVSEYFSTIERQITSMAFDQATQTAMDEFSRAYDRYDAERPSATIDADQLREYYVNEFGATYEQRNQGSVDAMALHNGLSPKATLLQHDLIAANPHPRGAKDSLSDVGNDTSYNQAHLKYHPTYQQFLNNFEYYDIFLIDVAGNVVYSVFKELDYATNLVSGPYKHSGLADAFNNALALSSGETYLTDFNSYLPSYNDPASFIGSPIYAGGEKIGVLVFQMPIAKLNNIMTQNQNWQTSGFGESGEVYLVGTR